jgi:hypothetical protein
MRVILDLDETVLKGFQELAEKEKRSRKNIMEVTLENYLLGGNPVLERGEEQNSSESPPPSEPEKKEEKPTDTKTAKELLFKEGDPPEGTSSFFMKYDHYTYASILKSKNQ